MVFLLVKNMCSFPNPHDTGYGKHENLCAQDLSFSSGRQTISHQTRWNKYLGVWNVYLFMKRVRLKAMHIADIKLVALRARTSFCPALGMSALVKDGVKMATTIQHKYGMPRIASDTPKSASGSFCFRWYGFTMGSFRLSQGNRHSICLIGSDKNSPIWATIFKTKQCSLLVPIFGDAPYDEQRRGNHPSRRLWSQATPASSPVGTHGFH